MVIPNPLSPVIAVCAASCCFPSPGQAQSGPEPDGDTIRIETSEGTALNFDVSSDGRFIVFDLLGQLWRLPADGGRAVPITDAVQDTTEYLFPSISPDGGWIAYAASGPGGPGSWLMSTSTGERRRFGPPGAVGSSAWSPDGGRILLAGGNRLVVYTVATGETTMLETGPRPPGRRLDAHWHPQGDRVAFGAGRDAERRVWETDLIEHTTTPITEEGLAAFAPRYAPSGSAIAFLIHIPDSASATQVAVMDLATKAWRVVTDLEDVYGFRWAASDRELLVTARGRLWRVPVSSGPIWEIPFTARVEFQRPGPAPPLTFPEPGASLQARGHAGLAIAPDGQTVAVIALGKLWTVPIDGTPKIVTTVHRFARGLSWSPDGRAIAWSGGASGTEDLFVTTVADGTTRRLTALPGVENRPSWSPDGALIAFVHWEKPALDTPPWTRGPFARLRVVAATGDSITRLEQTTDLGELLAYTKDSYYPGQELPSWSSTSDALLVTADSNHLGWAPRIVSLDGSSTPVAGLPESATYLTWASDSSVIFVLGNRLYRGQLVETAVTRTELLTKQAATCPSVSLDGSVLYRAPDGIHVRRSDGTDSSIGWPIAGATAPAPSPLVLANVRVFDATRGTVGGASDIVIERGRIAAIAPAGTRDRDTEYPVIDGNGRLALPGLIDLHIHAWEPSRVVNDLYFGVTTVRDLGSPAARLAALRDAIDAGAIDGPRLVMGGPQFFPGASARSGSVEQRVNDYPSIERALDLAAGLGVQHAKLYRPGPMALAAHLVRAARERGMRITGHCAHHLPLVAAGMSGVEHLGHIGCPMRANRLWHDDLIQLFSLTGIGVTPTVQAGRSHYFHAMFDDPDIARAVPPGLRTDLLQIRPEVVARVQFDTPNDRHAAVRRVIDTGVMLGAGSDGYVPSALHWELEGLVLAGLSPAQALTSATATAARILGAEGSIGTIAVGMLADIVLLDADPLEDIRNTRRIWMVIKGGAVIDRDRLLETEHYHPSTH